MLQHMQAWGLMLHAECRALVLPTWILTGMDTPSTVAGEDKQQHEEALAVCLLFPTLADVRLVVV